MIDPLAFVFATAAVGATLVALLAIAYARRTASQLRHLTARNKHVHKRERRQLEELVVARTVQLDRKNAEMRLVFDHVDQGFLMVDPDGLIASERSSAIERWLGPLPGTGGFVDYVRKFAPLAADWFEMTWEMLANNTLPVDLCLAQLPSRFCVDGRHLLATYKSLSTNGRHRILVVFSDDTANVERERAERDERETTTLLSRILHDRSGFLAFCAEADRHVALLCQDPEDREVVRAIHTLKGICAIEGLNSIAELCHDLESAIAENHRAMAAQCGRDTAARWATLREKVAPFLDLVTERLDLSFADLDQLELAIARRADHEELERLVAIWRHDRVLPRLERFADQARVLASRLCKDPIEVRVEADADLRLPTGRFRGFWSTFVHAIRNAIDHGIESPSERALLDKPASAVVVLRAHRKPGQVIVELEDHGRGIDWERIAESARRKGLPAETRADLEDALFADGLSTRTEVSEFSGRGVGMGAFRQACQLSGGKLVLSSTQGLGTRISVVWTDTLLTESNARPIQLVG